MDKVENIDFIGSHLIENSQTVAIAESVTSGGLQTAMSLGKNAMKFFQGGLTAYNIGQKARHLKVDPIHALACNCVSEDVAAKMALEITALFSSNWGIGITGYASLVPECNIHNLFALVAFVFNGRVVHQERINAQTMSPDKVQQYYVNETLKLFGNVLNTTK